MSQYVCARCESPAEKSLSELIRVSGWRGISIEVDGVCLRAVPTGERDVDWYDIETELRPFHCSKCDARFATLEEAVVARPEYECRECCWRGGDRDDHRCEAEPVRIGPPEVNAAQESLV